MARVIDLEIYRMHPRYTGRRAWTEIRPSTQGEAEVGDTVHFSDGDFKVTSIGTPFKLKSGAMEVRLWLEEITR